MGAASSQRMEITSTASTTTSTRRGGDGSGAIPSPRSTPRAHSDVAMPEIIGVHVAISPASKILYLKIDLTCMLT